MRYANLLSMDERPIVSRLIIEMLGSPKEHLEKTIKAYIEKLKKEGPMELVNVHFEEPTEKGSNMFSMFAEIEAKFPKLTDLIAFCFDAMPSSVEVLEPFEMLLKTNDLSDFLNDMQSRLHQVDMRLKYFAAENKKLDKNALTLFNNFIAYALKQGDKTLEELSQVMGLPGKSLEPFLKVMLEEKRVVEKEGKYSAVK